MRSVVMMIAFVVASATTTFAQQYSTKTASISFFSKASLENIEAKSNQVTSIIDFGTGEVVFKMQIKTFQFDKALMQEHFNEKYMESEKFPQSTFKGKIANYSKIDPTKDGEHKVKVTGDLTIHGVTKSYTTDGTITIKGGKVSVGAKFPVKLADHNVSIPSAVKDNIAETVDVTVSGTYAPLPPKN